MAYLASVCTIMCCDGIISLILPIATLNIFGLKRGPQVYSLLLTSTGVASLILIVMIKIIKKYEGYLGMFIISGLL